MSEPFAPPPPAPKKPPRFGRAREAQAPATPTPATPPIQAVSAATPVVRPRGAARFIPRVLLDWDEIPEPTGQLAELGKLAAASLSGPAQAQQTTLAEFRARYRSDFLGMCQLLEIKPKAVEGHDGSEVETSGDGTIRLVLTPIQAAYCAIRGPRDIILKPRQVKITTVELARDLWFWLTKRAVGVRVVCQSSSEHTMQSEISDRFNVYFEALRRNAGLDLRASGVLTTDSRTGWQLADGGSTLIILEAGASAAAAQKKGRGGTIHRLHTTELAFCEHAGATLAAILPSMPKSSVGTEIVHESTPNGVGGDDRSNKKNAAGGPIFYWLVKDARERASGFQFIFFNWMQEAEYQTPLDVDSVTGEVEAVEPVTDREHAVIAAGATPEQLKWYRAQVVDMGQDVVDQDYPLDPDTCFLVSGRNFFDKGITQGLMDRATEPLETYSGEIKRNGAVGSFHCWRPYEDGKRYVVSADTSEGTGGNAGGGQVYERGSGLHCATLHGQFKPDQLAIELAKIGEAYGLAEVAVERNNHGAACIQELDRVGLNPDGSVKVAYPNIWRDHDGKLGWNNVHVKRVAALDNLEAAHRNGEWTSLDVAVIGEFRSFIVTKTGFAEAARGAQDDLVIMAAIAWDVLRQVPAKIYAQGVARDASNLPRLEDRGRRFEDDDRGRGRGRGRDDGGRGYG